MVQMNREQTAYDQPVKIIPESDVIKSPEELQSNLKGLTPAERSVLFVLHNSETPYTIKQIKNAISADILNFLKRKSMDSELVHLKTMFKAQPKKSVSYSVGGNSVVKDERENQDRLNIMAHMEQLELTIARTPQYKAFYFCEDLHTLRIDTIEEMIGEFRKKVNALSLTSFSLTMEIIDSILSSRGIRLPSHQTLKKAIESLLALHFVYARANFESKKAKGIYYLNPRLDVLMSKLETKQ
jgi:hypothetical protein